MTLGLGRAALVKIPDQRPVRDGARPPWPGGDLGGPGGRPAPDRRSSATVGTTSSTSADPVAAVADIAEREGVWLHVDAAYAGVVALLPDMRGPFAGWERADSIVINPHKWLFTPLDASLLLSRRMDRCGPRSASCRSTCARWIARSPSATTTSTSPSSVAASGR